MTHDRNTAPVRVLLCEDSIVSRMIAEATCERLGCQVTACEDVDAALRLIGPPDLPPPFDFVLTDMHLQGESGLDLVRSIRSMGWSGFRLPIAVMTAQPSAEDEAVCHAAGGQFVLAKPLSETVLGEIVDRAKPLVWRGEGDRILQDVKLVKRYQRAMGELDAALTTAPEDIASPSPARTRLIALLHEIAGVGSLFGNPDLAVRANRLENALRAGLPDGWTMFETERASILEQINVSVFSGSGGQIGS